MLYKTIIFTNSPLIEGYRYMDKFQLVPFYYANNAPFSKYANHFPAFLEFEADGEEELMVIDDDLRRKGIPESAIRWGHSLPAQQRVKREILHLLTSITNFQFFEYNVSMNGWGIQVPMKDVKELSKDEKKDFELQSSHWTLRAYTYPNLKDDLKIERFTNCLSYIKEIEDSRKYFTENPNVENNPKISLPPNLNYCLDRYYEIADDLRKQIRHCIGLMADGVELFDYRRSVSLLAIVSSIEGMANIDFKLSNETENDRPTSRFVRYLKRYVAGRSEEKYRTYYKKRCDISHDGTIFLGDDDIYGDINEQNTDWRMRLEILQVARLALYNWLSKRQ